MKDKMKKSLQLISASVGIAVAMYAVGFMIGYIVTGEPITNPKPITAPTKVEIKSPKWQTVGNYQVDMNSLKNAGKYKEAWMKIHLNDSGYDVVGYVAYDCSRQSYQLISADQYDKNGVHMDGYDHYNMRKVYYDMNSEWKVVPPETSGFPTMQKICGMK